MRNGTGIQIWEGASTTVRTEHNIISNNYVTSTYASGIVNEWDKADFNAIIGNTVKNCMENTADLTSCGGISSLAGDFININSNVIEGQGMDTRGVSITGDHINVTNNNVSSASPAIYLPSNSSASDVNISANSFSSLSDEAILIEGRLMHSLISANSGASGGVFLKINPSATSENISVVGNKISDTKSNGIWMENTVDVTISSNSFQNINDATNDGVYLCTACSNVDVVNNTFIGVRYAVREDGATNNNILNNVIRDASSPSLVVQSSGTYVAGNKGFVTKNNGTSTVSSGSTSVTVAHGLDLTPDNNDIILTPLDNLAGESVWVSGANSENFVINLSSTLGSSVDIAWEAEAH